MAVGGLMRVTPVKIPEKWIHQLMLALASIGRVTKLVLWKLEIPESVCDDWLPE